MRGELSALFDAAKAAYANAYVPYSKFPVGAALCDEHGVIYAAANVENAAYPAGSCAEAGAISAMASAGGRLIVELLVVGGADGQLCTPCGSCRQRIREFARADCRIHIAGPEGMRATFTLGQLLPHSFGPGNLGNPQGTSS